MKNENNKKGEGSSRGVLNKIWHLIEASVSLGLLYTLFACVINKFNFLFSGTSLEPSVENMMATQLIAAPIIVIDLPDPLAEIIIICIVVGVATYLSLKYVCSQEWVQESVDIEECWEKTTWYNPWSWVTSIFCTIVEVLQWVLKQICEWVEVLVTLLVISCIILGIIILF
ncbi:MAG: hypothetical protein GQ474_07260 [Sulfurimonas sp.]|nr:hypothetical protein [Sulfurimonas sp.]